MSQTPGSSSSPLKRPFSISSEIPQSNSVEQDEASKRAKIESTIPGIDTSEIELSGISLPNTDSNISTPSFANETPLTPQFQQQVLQPNNNINNNNNNNNNNNDNINYNNNRSSDIFVPITDSNIDLQLPELEPSSNTTDSATANVDNTKPDELQKGPAPADPDKLSDALLSAGVDLKAEEALLTQNQLNLQASSAGLRQLQQPIVELDPFLEQRNLSSFINKIVAANKLRPLSNNSEEEKQILELVTASCQEWIKSILTSTIIISRHRRRSINKSNKKRSEVSKALRELANQDKLQEKNRVERKKKLGLLENGTEKEGTEEIQHKATNATVAMMTGGKKKKKYSWMTGGSGAGGAGAVKSGSGSGNVNDQTIRFREAREEPGIAVRDLLLSLEKKRMGTENTLVKGYAKLKD